VQKIKILQKWDTILLLPPLEDLDKNLLYNNKLMVLQRKIHVWKDMEDSKEVVERLYDENLENKLDHYLNKFEKKDDSEWFIELFTDKNKKGRFNGKLMINIDWHRYRYEREDYKKLDDLINHLFDHFKEELSSK